MMGMKPKDVPSTIGDLPRRPSSRVYATRREHRPNSLDIWIQDQQFGKGSGEFRPKAKGPPHPHHDARVTFDNKHRQHMLKHQGNARCSADVIGGRAVVPAVPIGRGVS